jgi:hypothetical protein
MSAAGDGPSKPKRDFRAGLNIYEHPDYLDALKDLPDGSADKILDIIRRYLPTWRKAQRKTGLMFAILDPLFSPGYKGPAAEVLFMLRQQKFVLLNIRLGGFSEEEIHEIEKCFGKG